MVKFLNDEENGFKYFHVIERHRNKIILHFFEIFIYDDNGVKSIDKTSIDYEANSDDIGDYSLELEATIIKRVKDKLI